MEHDPHAVLEGLALCAHAVGAQEGIVFVRGEYPRAADVLERAAAQAEAAGLLAPCACASCAERAATSAARRPPC